MSVVLEPMMNATPVGATEKAAPEKRTRSQRLASQGYNFSSKARINGAVLASLLGLALLMLL